MNTPAVYLHSAHADFAETQQLPADVYLGRCQPRGQLTFFACGCRAPRLTRIARSAWMRLIWRFHLYQCERCDMRVLRPRMKKRLVYGAVYLPPAPNRVADAVHRCTAASFRAMCERLLGHSR